MTTFHRLNNLEIDEDEDEIVNDIEIGLIEDKIYGIKFIRVENKNSELKESYSDMKMRKTFNNKNKKINYFLHSYYYIIAVTTSCFYQIIGTDSESNFSEIFEKFDDLYLLSIIWFLEEMEMKIIPILIQKTIYFF